MSLQFLHYYFYKDILKYIPSAITQKIQIDNQILFKYALFPNVADYYVMLNPFKKDHYQLTKQMKSDKGVLFIKECLQDAQKNEDSNQKFFVYLMGISRLLEQNFVRYIEGQTSKKKNALYVEKMLDSYYFSKEEKLFIAKVNIKDYFFDSFQLSESDCTLLENPMKRIFGFFRVEPYYQHCYQQAAFYFEHFASSTTGIKKVPYFFYDWILNHRKGKRKAKTFLYDKRIDTTVLNLAKSEYTLDGKVLTFSCEEVYQKAFKEAKMLCSVYNEYFNNENIKPFLKYYGLPEK